MEQRSVPLLLALTTLGVAASDARKRLIVIGEGNDGGSAAKFSQLLDAAKARHIQCFALLVANHRSQVGRVRQFGFDLYRLASGTKGKAYDVRKVEKPWGYELIWALTDVYCGKVLFVKAGHSLSLQFHREKDESWLVQSGRAKLELGEVGETVLKEEVISAGAAFHYPPGTVHRVTALEDTTILEVSTPQLDDVVRLEDAYGREGTSAA